MRKLKLHELILLILSFFSVFIWLVVFQIKGRDDFNVYYFYVGQGDSQMIVGPGNMEILIDGGPDSKVLNEVGKVMPFFDRKIELVILTHPHADHINGLIDVLNRYEIGEIWETQVADDSEVYKKWKELIKQKNILDTVPQVGTTKYLGNIKIETLAPTKNLVGKKVENLNNASIVNMVAYQDKKYLFTGDIEKEAQQNLINTGIDLKAYVLKQPHHGSENFLQAFLDKVAPQDVVVSCGLNNKFNFPNPNTLDKLKKYNVLRTDLNKTVEFSTLKSQLKIRFGL